MIKQETIVVGDANLVVKELAMDEIDQLFAGFEIDRQPTFVERLIDSPVPVEVVTAATGLTVDALGKYTPTELNEIWAATARVNDFLAKLAGQMATMLGNPLALLAKIDSGGSSAE